MPVYMYKCIRSPELCGWKAYTMEEFIQEYGGLPALWKRCMLLLHSNKLHANSLHSSQRILHPKKQSLCITSTAPKHSKPKAVAISHQWRGTMPGIPRHFGRKQVCPWQIWISLLRFLETSLLRTALLSNMKESDKAWQARDGFYILLQLEQSLALWIL
jgi:hypothetical protein